MKNTWSELNQVLNKHRYNAKNIQTYFVVNDTKITKTCLSMTNL